jgi:ubiquinone/menaquinone biosynthesis C-methylase UbiE
VPDDVRSRFAPVAANYTTSKFHADPARMEELAVLAQPRATDVCLDVATGTGNSAFALAPHVRDVVGLDITPEMLEQARAGAAKRSLDNVRWVLADAERLPFQDATFDLYTVRAAPHHFVHVERALSEAARVLKPGGRAAFIDCSPPTAARDRLHEVELGRDPSHVRSYTLTEWETRLETAGFVIEAADRRELDWDFGAWMDNMAVPVETVAELAQLVSRSQGEARAQLRPDWREGKLWHAYWHALIRARKPFR